MRQLFCWILSLVCAFTAMGDAMQVRDWLGREWKDEVVMFPLTEADRASAAANQALLDDAGNELPYQVIGDRLAVLTDLAPFSERTYTFAQRAASFASELRVEEQEDVVRLTNGKTGIALHKGALGQTQGPIAGIWLPTAGWVGGSWLEAPAIATWSVEVTLNGPVVSEVTCVATFSDNQRWTLLFRLQAGDAVVLIDESFEVGTKARWGLAAGRGLAPDHFQWRGSSGVAQGVKITTTEEELTFLKWQPWPLWGPQTGKWFGLYREAGQDLLMIGARNSEDWVDLRRPRVITLPVKLLGGEATLLLPLDRGQRRWMIGSFAKEASFPKAGESRTPLPQQAVIKYEFPLDRVKEYVLSWPVGEVEHPRLYVTPREVEAHKERTTVTPEALQRLMATPVTLYTLEQWIPAFLATGDATMGRLLADAALVWMQEAVDIQVRQERIASLGWSPHAQPQILVALSVADALVNKQIFTAEELARLHAQAAFLGYTVLRPDYWSPLRGFAANPNMTSHVACYQVLLGCFLPTHPASRSWVEEGLRELKDVELDTWMDANGGWIEAPGYAMVSFNYLLGAFIAARNSGYPDYVTDPKMKLWLGWLSKISTPPDNRLLGTRYVMPLGNTWKMAWCGDFGLAAALWQEADADFAAELAWMYRQHNSYNAKVGGYPSVLVGYREMLIAPVETITPAAPAYGSELFPESGVVLRSHFPSDRETMLYLIAGENAHHYDFDSGSVSIWGKGRIIADEFGYYSRAPVAEHSMLEIPVHNNAIMRVRDFATTPALDYVHASLAKEPPGDISRITDMIHLDYQHSVYNDWTRQIAFIKDDNPLGPNYFVINDSLRSPIPATWRMWFTCERVELREHGALVVGKEDVDTEIFFAWPDALALSAEELTRATSGYNTDAKYGRWEWTQTGLIADIELGLGFVAVVYPRLKDETPPVFTSLADGQGIRIESAAGVDHLFLSPRPIRYEADGIVFEGASGLIQQRGDRLRLALGTAGRIAVGDRILEATEATTQSW